MDKVMEAHPNPTTESHDQALTLLTAKEAIEYLRISLSTLNRMERKGQIVSLKTPGGHRRYTLDMLNACLSRGDTDLE
jgi:excisionase family DNA binding protein